MYQKFVKEKGKSAIFANNSSVLTKHSTHTKNCAIS